MIAGLLVPLAAVAQGEIDLTGTWDWTNHSNQTNDYGGPVTIEHDVAADTFTWHISASGPDSSAEVDGNGTVSGTQISITTAPYGPDGTYTAQYQGEIVGGGNQLEGTWTQSDGQDGTFEATRQGSPSPSPSPSSCPIDKAGDECPLKVGTVEFSFSERFASIKDEILPLNQQLLADRDSLRAALTDATQRMETEKAATDAALAESEALQKRLRDLKEDLRNGASRAEKEALAQLQGEVDAARKKWLELIEKLSRTVESVWSFERQLRDVQERQAKWAEPLAITDFRVRTIEVWTGSKMVYKVNYSDAFDKLRELNFRIKKLVERVQEAKKAKKNALDNFVYRHKIATGRLAKIADLIKVQAYFRAGVQGAKDLVDVLKAGAEGGVPGIGAEAVKKLYEFAVEYTTETSDPIGNPNPFENDPEVKEVERRFKEATESSIAKDAWEFAVDKGLMDPIKDALLKDPAEAVLCQAFYEKIGEACDAGHSTGPPLERIRKNVVERVTAMRRRVILLDKRLELFHSLGPVAALRKLGPRAVGKAVKTGLDVAHDAAAEFFNKQFDENEMNAWYEFVHADLVARQRWGIYQAESVILEDVVEELKGLVVDKAELLKNWEEEFHSRVVKNITFDMPDELSVEIKFDRTQSKIAPIPIEVLISGLTATAGTVVKEGSSYLSRGHIVTKSQLQGLGAAERAALQIELR